MGQQPAEPFEVPGYRVALDPNLSQALLSIGHEVAGPLLSLADDRLRARIGIREDLSGCRVRFAASRAGIVAGGCFQLIRRLPYIL